MSSKYEDLINNARINADCGEHMSPEEVTTLLNVVETTFAALAAENAGLKNAAEFATADDMWEELGGNVMRYQYQEWYADRLKSAMEIPATSASLAEVRAQGVESGIDMLIAIMNHQHPAASQAIDILRIHAEHLRKGVQS
ncbi:hypothetical protein [Enterobacter hormaechei]